MPNNESRRPTDHLTRPAAFQIDVQPVLDHLTQRLLGTVTADDRLRRDRVVNRLHAECGRHSLGDHVVTETLSVR
jgi:hypothetical protein